MNFNMSNQTDFVRYAVVDQQQQDLVAAAFEHPAGWQAESRVFWNQNHSTLPAVFQARVFDAQTAALFEFLPMANFSWTEPEMGIYGRGQNVGGTINLPPMPGVDALAHLIIPNYRGDRQGLRIVEADAQPAAVTPPAGIQPQSIAAQNVRVKIEYSENGQMFEEEFHALHLITQFPPVNNGWSMSYFTGWSLTSLCCFRAPRGLFDELRPTFLKIQSSLQINAQWIQLANQVSQMLLRNEKQIGDDMIQGGWDRLRQNDIRIREESARGWDRINDKWDELKGMYNNPPPSSDPYKPSSDDSEYTMHDAQIDLIRGEESIYNPADSSKEKVSGYHDYIWVDERGNTLGTDNPNFDPNIGSDRTWTPARKKRIGD